MSGVSKETSHIFTWIFEDRLSCMKKITGQAVFLYLLEKPANRNAPRGGALARNGESCFATRARRESS